MRLRARVLVGGAASILLVGLFATPWLWVWRSLPAQRVTEAAPTSGSQEVHGWTVMTLTSAHGAMVVEVRTAHLEDSLTIAHAIVEPVLAKGYSEILVYVHPPTGFGDGPMRRVQWTPQTGYVETVFAPAVP